MGGARRGPLVGVLVVLSLAAAAGASAAPVAGGRLVRTTVADAGDIPLNLLDSPFGSLTPSFLPDAACPLALAPLGAHLEADLTGWEGPTLPVDSELREENLHADLHGTVADTAGNHYDVAGTFDESGIPAFTVADVPFQGAGRVTLTGPAGTVTGEALFVDVTAGPPEWDLYFTGAVGCSLTPAG